MLKPISRLRSICKGDLNHNTNPHLLLSIRQKQHVGRNILHSIPVLSIFVLLGIISYSTIVIGFGEVDGEVYAETIGNNTSLIIDNGAAADSTITARGDVTYSAHTVQVKADNITGYTLSITGPTTLSNGGTTINGAGGKTGSTMNDNTWGYGWNTTSTSDANMTYNSFTGNAQTLSGDSVANNSINFTRKLVFAAKFNQNAAEGHYKANVTLNLTITPKTVTTYNYSVTYNLNGGTGTAPVQKANSDSQSYTFYVPVGDGLTRTNYRFWGWATSSTATKPTYEPGAAIPLTSSNNTKTLYALWRGTTWNTISYMQDMTVDICASVSTGVDKTLKDIRDGNSYTIRKLADGKCWMTTNLKLDLSIKGIATAAESDNLSSDFPPESIVNRFATDSTDSSNLFGYDGMSFAKAPQRYNASYGPYQTSYGYYYGFQAAIANTLGINEAGVAFGSICPKGWKIPKLGDYGSITYYKSWATDNNGAEGMWLNSKSPADNGIFFPAAGYIPTGNSTGLDWAGRYGLYWTRQTYTSTAVHYLRFDKPSSTETSSNSGQMKATGMPVRCVAYSS